MGGVVAGGNGNRVGCDDSAAEAGPPPASDGWELLAAVLASPNEFSVLIPL